MTCLLEPFRGRRNVNRKATPGQAAARRSPLRSLRRRQSPHRSPHSSPSHMVSHMVSHSSRIARQFAMQQSLDDEAQKPQPRQPQPTPNAAVLATSAAPPLSPLLPATGKSATTPVRGGPATGAIATPPRADTPASPATLRDNARPVSAASGALRLVFRVSVCPCVCLSCVSG